MDLQKTVSVADLAMAVGIMVERCLGTANIMA
jgi:hypothetical protein